MFQNWQKTAYQTSSNQSIFMVFDRFDDVWYAVFCQFWNKNYDYFPRGYGILKNSVWGSILNPFKIGYFVVNTPEKNVENFSFKTDKKPHTKHHQINQISMVLIDLMTFGTRILPNFLECMSYTTAECGLCDELLYQQFLRILWNTNK